MVWICLVRVNVGEAQCSFTESVFNLHVKNPGLPLDLYEQEIIGFTSSR
jgi:hypothetical protein